MTTAKIIPLLAFCSLLAACDEGDPQSLDRAANADDEIMFRGIRMRGGSGSTRLNTAKLNGDFEIGNFAHMRDDGSEPTWTWGEDQSTQIQLTGASFILPCDSPESGQLGGGVQMGNNSCLHDFTAGQHTLKIEHGRAKIDQVQLTTVEMLGSEWRFTLVAMDAQNHPSPPKFATVEITGAAEATVPSAGPATVVPLYNFELKGLVDEDGVSSLETGGICEPLDGITLSNMDISQVADHWDPTVLNNWDAEYAGSFYGGVFVDGESAEVTADEELIFLGCASGAMVKAALWGYPPYVDTAMGMDGVQQLQAATRAIRADYCADGISHTQVGTPIQIVDRFTDQFDDPKKATETIWGANGSRSEVYTPRVGTPVVSGICGSGPSQSPAEMLPGGSLLQQEMIVILASFVDWRQLGMEWISNNDQQFMWTRFAGGNDVGVAADPSCCVGSLTPGCTTAAVS
ncbi:MAG TPA: hypothetical protein ENJ18_02185, partial [Nannocystis exedens]|nr:hypothetical protein [Nannocystis exedens]